MIDPFLILGALLHVLLLTGGIVIFCRRLAVPWRDWPFTVYILVWADLVLAGHGASLFQSLDKLDVYVSASFLALAGLLGALLVVHRLAPVSPLLKPPRLDFAVIDNVRIRKFLFWFLIVTLALAALAEITLGLSVYPDNADSMIYRLPRAFWYVSQGSFLHPFEALDKRLAFYPLNGVALNVPLVLYSLPGTAFSLPSLATWALLVYTVYRFARALGAERLIALFSAWLIGLTPSILAQATSTNDEILTATVLLTGLYMGWRWLVTGKRIYFLLAVLAVSLSIGTKLHIVFLMPIVLAAFGIAAWHARKNPALLQRWLKAIGRRTGLLSFLAALLMIAPFLLYNYISTGRFYFLGDFAHDVFNLRASAQGALQNLLIYVSQMVLSPIADLNFWPVANDRQHFNAALNDLFNPLIKPFINDDASFYHFTYRFVGVTLPVSVRFVEFSLWSGFVWLLWPWQWRLTLKQRFPLRPLFFLLAITPPLWLLLWSAATLYMEGTATYFTFYLICAAPAMAFTFAPIRRILWNDLRWVTIVVVALTNLIISTNLLMFSGFRALPDLVYARKWPYDWCLVDQKIIDEIRRADRIRIIITHEKMPYFAFMHWNPRARYYNPYAMTGLSEPDKVLQILPITSLNEFRFMPLKIPGKSTTGLTYLGTIRGIGREAIFATGNGVHKRAPDQSDYILPHLTLKDDNGNVMVSLDDHIAGLNNADNLEFSYEMKHDNAVVFRRDWDRNPVFNVSMPHNHSKTPTFLTLIVRSALSHKEITRATYEIGVSGSWLPEGGEY
jgi:hypothetical protein